MTSPKITGAIDLAVSPVHISNGPSAIQHNFSFDGPGFESYVAAHCTQDNPGRLVMIEESPTDWGAWECHNDGDELVIVIAGSGTFFQEIDGETQAHPFTAGDTFLNPAGVWHTADVTEPMRAIYLTPCPGTEHKPR